MPIKQIKAYYLNYRPLTRNFPIRECRILIYAENEAEARKIAMTNDYKFFNLDHTIEVEEIPIIGFQK